MRWIFMSSPAAWLRTRAGVGSAEIVRSFAITRTIHVYRRLPLLQAINIHKSYNALNVLKGIDLTIEKSEIVSIVGSSGAGKSTLLHILGTLDSPDSGEVLFDGESVSS